MTAAVSSPSMSAIFAAIFFAGAGGVFYFLGRHAISSVFREMKNAKNSKMPKRQAAGKPASQTADYGLQFPPGDRCGITSISLSVGKHNPPAIAREILQNSLDAAKHAGRQCARVLFSLESVEVADIPGIADYKNA